MTKSIEQIGKENKDYLQTNKSIKIDNFLNGNTKNIKKVDFINRNIKKKK